jgi:hypothetical protein
MKITEEVRELAKQQEIETGLAAKAAEFKETGGELYVKSR